MVERSARAEVLGDSGTYLASKAIPGLIGFLSVGVFLRGMGPEVYGRFTLGFTVVNTVAAFCVGWLTQAVLRYHSTVTGTHAMRPVLRVGLFMSLAGGALFLIAASVSGVLPRAAFPVSELLVLFGVVVGLSLFLVRGAVLQAEIRPRGVMWVGTAQALLALLLPIAFFLAVSGTHTAVLVGIALSYLAPALWRPSWLWGGPHEASAADHPDWRRLAREMWKFGWPLSLWSAIVAALQVSDRHFIQHFWGFEQAGAFAGAYDLVFRGYTLALFPITLAAHPRMMHHWNANRRADAWSMWRWALGVQFGLFAIVLVACIWLRDLAVWIVEPGSDLVRSLILPLVLGGFLWQVGLLAHKPLELAGRTRLMLAAAVLALGANVAANAILLPRLGVLVTAWATAASGLLYLALVLGMGAIVHRASWGEAGA